MGSAEPDSVSIPLWKTAAIRSLAELTIRRLRILGLHGLNGGLCGGDSPSPDTPRVECRDGGGSYSFVFSFTTNVVSGNASGTMGTGTVGTPTFSGMTMTVPLTIVTDVSRH